MSKRVTRLYKNVPHPQSIRHGYATAHRNYHFNSSLINTIIIIMNMNIGDQIEMNRIEHKVSEFPFHPRMISCY